VDTSMQTLAPTRRNSAFPRKNSPLWSNKVIGSPIPASPGFLSVSNSVHLWPTLLRSSR
jgi:hypothetical protein